jgi:hypothetical protein
MLRRCSSSIAHDGKVRLHVIARKDDVGDSIYADRFPPR